MTELPVSGQPSPDVSGNVDAVGAQPGLEVRKREAGRAGTFRDRRRSMRYAVHRLASDVAVGAVGLTALLLLAAWSLGLSSALAITVSGGLLVLAAHGLARVSRRAPDVNDIQVHGARPGASADGTGWRAHRLLQALLAASSALLLELLLASTYLNNFIGTIVPGRWAEDFESISGSLTPFALIMTVALILDLPLRIWLKQRDGYGKPASTNLHRVVLGLGYGLPVLGVVAFLAAFQSSFAIQYQAVGGIPGSYVRFLPFGSPDQWTAVGASLGETVLQVIMLSTLVLVPVSIIAGLLLDHSQQSPGLRSHSLQNPTQQSPAPSLSEEGRI